MIQTPVVLMDYCGTIADGTSANTVGVPIIGLTMASGLIYSDRAVTLIMKQGVSEHTGAFVYRHTRNIAIPAGECRAIEFPVFGKYCSLEIANASGGLATVEVFFSIRKQE